MPGNYAHYRFGKTAFSLLPPQAQQEVSRFRRLYDMGLHGPDIFFYHHPLTSGKPGAPGKVFHRMSGLDFFPGSCAAAKTEAHRAYLYGLLTHYCLDSVAHPYVRSQAEAGTARHVEMEVEFDRYLMALDGIPSPHTYDQTGHMKLTREECIAVADFYGTTAGVIRQAAGSMVTASRLLTLKWRRAMKLVLSLAPEAVSDQQMYAEPNPRCETLTPALLECYERALRLYPSLLEQLLRHLETGEPLGEDFRPDFG